MCTEPRIRPWQVLATAVLVFGCSGEDLVTEGRALVRLRVCSAASVPKEVWSPLGFDRPPRVWLSIPRLRYTEHPGSGHEISDDLKPSWPELMVPDSFECSFLGSGLLRAGTYERVDVYVEDIRMCGRAGDRKTDCEPAELAASSGFVPLPLWLRLWEHRDVTYTLQLRLDHMAAPFYFDAVDALTAKPAITLSEPPAEETEPGDEPAEGEGEGP
jgi:hypothetical protein